MPRGRPKNSKNTVSKEQESGGKELWEKIRPKGEYEVNEILHKVMALRPDEAIENYLAAMAAGFLVEHVRPLRSFVAKIERAMQAMEGVKEERKALEKKLSEQHQ